MKWPCQKIDGVKDTILEEDFFSYFISFHPLYGIRDAQAKLLLLFCRQNFVFWKEMCLDQNTVNVPELLCGTMSRTEYCC